MFLLRRLRRQESFRIFYLLKLFAFTVLSEEVVNVGHGFILALFWFASLYSLEKCPIRERSSIEMLSAAKSVRSR